MGSDMYMTSQDSPDESSFYSDPFKICPSKSPHQHRHAATQLPEVQQETVPSSPRPYPVSIRAYNKKDYHYIASFPRAAHVGMKPNRSKTELLQCQETHNRLTDDDAMASILHPPKTPVSLPEFGAWNAKASPSSVEGYTDVFDRVREQKRGGISSAQSLPQHLQTPVRGLAKELAVAKISSHVSTHHRKWSLNWSRCFVSPVTTE